MLKLKFAYGTYWSTYCTDLKSPLVSVSRMPIIDAADKPRTRPAVPPMSEMNSNLRNLAIKSDGDANYEGEMEIPCVLWTL